MKVTRRSMLLSGAAGVAGASLGTGLWSDMATAQVRGGRMNVILSPEPPTLMLGLNQQSPTQIVAGKIYQGLLTYDFNLKPMPGLAREWTVSPDGLTYTFKLFENVRWHDGKPFTAEDVIFSTQKFLMEVHARARANFSRVAEARAVDPLTVEYKLKAPFAPFLLAFEVSSAPMVPKHIYDGTDFRNNPANQTPIGTGPFKFKEWRRGQFVHLVKNEEYFKKGLPHLQEIFFQVIPDAASRLVAMESGQTHLASFGDIEYVFMPQVRANPNLEVTDKGYEFAGPLAWIEFNHRIKPMDDKRFRQAVMHALDRNFIQKNIWFGQAKVATGPFNSSTRFYDPKTKQYPFNPAVAERLLEEMGLQKDANGNRATLKLLGLPYGDSWNKLSEYIRQALRRVGVNVVLESTDAGNWAKRYSDWDFEMTIVFLYQFGDPALGVSRTYLSTNIRKGAYGTNASGYVNPEVDRLFEAAVTQVDEEKRQELYSQVQRVLCEDVPQGWLLELKFPTTINRSFRNVVTTAVGVAETFEQTERVR